MDTPGAVRRGAAAFLHRARALHQEALGAHGPSAPLGFPRTIYHLPIIFSVTGRAVRTLGDVAWVLEEAERLITGEPAPQQWTPVQMPAGGGWRPWLAEVIGHGHRGGTPPGRVWLGAADDAVAGARRGVRGLGSNFGRYRRYLGGRGGDLAEITEVTLPSWRGWVGVLSCHRHYTPPSRTPHPSSQPGSRQISLRRATGEKVVSGFGMACPFGPSFCARPLHRLPSEWPWPSEGRGGDYRLFTYIKDRPRASVAVLGPVNDLQLAAARRQLRAPAIAADILFVPLLAPRGAVMV